MDKFTDSEIAARFESGRQDVDSLVAPLISLAHDSSSLIVGFGMTQSGLRSDMIPYFHVCGTTPVDKPVRILLIGGIVGTEIVTPFAVARLLAALEARLQLVAGLEVTGFPVANLEAHREGVFLTSAQQADGAKCWENSACSHIQVLERELKRYEYDLVIVLRENVRAEEADIEAWLVEDEQKRVVSDALYRHATIAPGFRWSVNPVRPTYPRTFTPVPGSERQPAEVIVGLPGALPAEAQAENAMGLVLSVAHAVRQARDEGFM